MQDAADREPTCQYCAAEPEPGWIETPNNGPIGPCPVCNPLTSKDREIELAWELHEQRNTR